MTSLYCNQEVDASNYVFKRILSILYSLRPGEDKPAQVQYSIRPFLCTGLTLLLVFFLATEAQARTYDVVESDIPFNFNIGSHSFHSGHYQLIIVGNGLLAMRDSHHRVIASLITRSVETGSMAAETKIVFQREKKHVRLSEILILHRSQVLEVLGEQVAIRQSPPPAELPPDLLQSLFQRQPAPMTIR